MRRKADLALLDDEDLNKLQPGTGPMDKFERRRFQEAIAAGLLAGWLHCFQAIPVATC